jgi:hypothetical protein
MKRAPLKRSTVPIARNTPDLPGGVAQPRAFPQRVEER